MSEPVHKFTWVNGVRLHYVEAGSGPLVVLAHGWPESWYSWRHQIAALAAAGFRVIAPDQRGYGESDAPAAREAYDITQLVADLSGLVSELGESRAAIVGHDWGSIVASHAALMRPDIFHRVALLSVPFHARPLDPPEQRLRLASARKHFYQQYFQEPDRIERELGADLQRSLLGIYYTGSGEAARDAVNPRRSFLWFDKTSRFVDNLTVPDRLPPWLTDADLEVYVKQFSHNGMRGPINWYRNFQRNWELTPFLAGARPIQEVLFIAGSEDGVLKMTAEALEGMEANVPRLIDKIIIKGAGHWIQQEAPVEVNAALMEFLARENRSNSTESVS